LLCKEPRRGGWALESVGSKRRLSVAMMVGEQEGGEEVEEDEEAEDVEERVAVEVAEEEEETTAKALV
jgi:hypothetical protein